MFLPKKGLDFLFKEADNIWTLLTFFSKVQTKNKPFGFHFSKGSNNKLRVWIPATHGGGGGGGVQIKMEHPTGINDN